MCFKFVDVKRQLNYVVYEYDTVAWMYTTAWKRFEAFDQSLHSSLAVKYGSITLHYIHTHTHTLSLSVLTAIFQVNLG